MRLRDVSGVDAVLVVGHGLDVERRVWQSTVHHRQTHRRQEEVQHGDDQQVPVIRRAFLQSTKTQTQ